MRINLLPSLAVVPLLSHVGKSWWLFLWKLLAVLLFIKDTDTDSPEAETVLESRSHGQVYQGESSWADDSSASKAEKRGRGGLHWITKPLIAYYCFPFSISFGPDPVCCLLLCTKCSGWPIRQKSPLGSKHLGAWFRIRSSIMEPSYQTIQELQARTISHFSVKMPSSWNDYNMPSLWKCTQCFGMNIISEIL